VLQGWGGLRQPPHPWGRHTRGRACHQAGVPALTGVDLEASSGHTWSVMLVVGRLMCRAVCCNSTPRRQMRVLPGCTWWHAMHVGPCASGGAALVQLLLVTHLP
jgi:hypothetical protein